MGKVASALGFGMGDDSEESPPSISEDVDELDAKAEEPKGGSAEVLAMKMFMSAGSPEDKVAAFKHLLEACSESY